MNAPSPVARKILGGMVGCMSPDLLHLVRGGARRGAVYGGYFAGCSPRAERVRGDRTSAAAFLDLWLQPDSPTSGFPHFPLPDLPTSPPPAHQLPSVPDPVQLRTAAGKERAGWGWEDLLHGFQVLCSGLTWALANVVPGISALTSQ